MQAPPIPTYPYALLVRAPLIALIVGVVLYANPWMRGGEPLWLKVAATAHAHGALMLAMAQCILVPRAWLRARAASVHRHVLVQLSLICGVAYAWLCAALMADVR